MIGVGVIGYGYWGPNLVRNFAECPGSRVVAVCDQKTERLGRAAARHPGIAITSDFQELIRHPQVDAVAIATPAASHFDLCMAALKAGKHVLVEKPITNTSEQAMRLVEEAASRHLVLMVDHTFVYHSAVRKMRELIVQKQLGELYYIDSVRLNLGLFQHDVSVLWDLAVHDLSIMDFLLQQRPRAISATGIRHVPGRLEDLAYVTLFFNDNLVAHIHVNWLAPAKVRQMIVAGSGKMLVYDDVQPSEKIRVYDKGVDVVQPDNPDDVHKILVSYRTGDIWIPKLDNVEALQSEVQEFCRCIATGGRPQSDGECGVRIVQMLEAAGKSLSEQGRPVELATGVLT